MAKVDGTHIKISIHALREEGDACKTRKVRRKQ